MTHELEARNHPTDAALAAWVDARIGRDEAPAEIDRGVASHLAVCPACAERVRELEAVVASLRAEPPAPATAELAARRAEVMRRIEGQGARVTPLRRWWWVPTAAAAALAFLLLARPGDDGPAPRDVAERPAAERAQEAEPGALPVVAAAQDAADEAARTLTTDSLRTETVEGEVAILDPSTAPLPGVALADGGLVTEFAALGAEDQEAILDELAAMEFQL